LDEEALDKFQERLSIERKDQFRLKDMCNNMVQISHKDQQSRHLYRNYNLFLVPQVEQFSYHLKEFQQSLRTLIHAKEAFNFQAF